VLSVNLRHEQLATMFLEPITRFRDEAFYDAIGPFLRGFDRATVAANTRNPENPTAVRRSGAARIELQTIESRKNLVGGNPSRRRTQCNI
jgi:hypothetical protein